MSTTNPYDEVPYISNPFPETHPDRMCSIARILGLDAPDPQSARVLELGCASGGNLVPIAYVLPGATFVGIDLSAKQVADGQKILAELGLKNIELRHLSITDVTSELGKFDYIICHGVFSWVPTHVQNKVLEICRDQLTPSGLAFISFNTFPGWHMRRWVRELMQYRAEGFPDPIQKVRAAKAFLKAVSESPSIKGQRAETVLKGEIQHLESKTEDYVLHEYLEDHNEPFYFYEFMKRVGGYGLQYVGDARLNGTAVEEASPESMRLLKEVEGDLLRTEQMADFLRNRMFRRALLSPAAATIRREGLKDRLRQMHIASPMRREQNAISVTTREPLSFNNPHGGGLQSSSPVVKAALVELQQVFPATLPYPELAEKARAALAVGGVEFQEDLLIHEIMRYWMSNLIEIHARPPVFEMKVSERPRTTAVARLAARTNSPIPSLRHEVLSVDAPTRKFISLLDGTRTAPELARSMLEGHPEANNPTTIKQAQDWVEKVLPAFGRSAMLEA